MTYKNPSVVIQDKKHKCVKDRVFVCKEKEQGCMAIRDLMSNGNSGIVMIEVPLHLEI